ncbi:N-acetylmuramoyl-L-alanine amidase [Pedobacter sp.]|uniref:N-acetylmuramoyl-L-alanine amidase n=1 Tax=Pedobacter sp. TaxID=1411316 RepID=UPI00396C87F1
MRLIKYIVLHCTATPHNTSIDSIMNYWRTVLGWKNPGYHYMIKADGEIVNTFPIEQVSNGVAGYNANSIHISYIGGIDEKGKAVDNRTPQQIVAQIRLLKELKAKFPAAEIKGHRDFPNVKKECPCFDVKTWLRTISLLIALCVSLTACKVSQNRQLNKSSSITSEMSTATTDHMAETVRETEARHTSNRSELNGATIYNFNGKVNADGSIEGSASQINTSSQKNASTSSQIKTKVQIRTITKTLLVRAIIKETHIITQTVVKTVTKTFIPWWVWLAGLAAVAVSLFFDPTRLFVKLKNLIKWQKN